MTTKRRVENELEQLKENAGGDETEPIIISCTSIGPDEETPHPELTIQRHGRDRIAVPKYIPPEYATPRVVFVARCGSRTGATQPDGTDYITPCTLWDSLSDEQLRAEARYRVEHSEPIPPLLEPYTPD